MKRFLLTFLPVFFTGTFIFGQTTGYQATVKLIFNGNPESAIVTKAPLKYNKDFAYSFTFDDGKGDIYRNVYPYFEGGTIIEKNLTFPGLSYSDGCGNSIKFKGAIAMNSVNGAGEDLHDGSHPQSISWTQLKELYSKGWNVLNHSYSHASGAGTDYDYQVKQNNSYIYSKTGITTTHFVVPSGDSNYVPVAFGNGMKAVYNQQSSFPGTDGLKVDHLSDLSQFKLFRRFVSDERYDDSNIKEFVDHIASQSSASNHLWFTDFTHSVPFEAQGGSLLFSTFQNYMSYIENTYGIKGTDRIWMAPLQEVYEYLVVKNQVSYTSEISGDTLILHLNFQTVPDDLDQYAISFNIQSAEDFQNVIAENIDGYSFKGSGTDKMLNINFKKEALISSLKGSNKFKTCNEKSSLYFSVDKNLHFTTKGKPGEILSLRIYSVDGKEIFQTSHVCTGEYEEVKISLQSINFEPGIYIVKFLKNESNCGLVKKVYLH